MDVDAVKSFPISLTTLWVRFDSPISEFVIHFRQLNDNFLVELPSDLARLRNLRVLRAENNRLRSVPIAVLRLAKLERLELAGNPIDANEEDRSDVAACDKDKVAENGGGAAEALHDVLSVEVFVCRAVASLKFEDDDERDEFRDLLVGEFGVARGVARELLAAVDGVLVVAQVAHVALGAVLAVVDRHLTAMQNDAKAAELGVRLREIQPVLQRTRRFVLRALRTAVAGGSVRQLETARALGAPLRRCAAAVRTAVLEIERWVHRTRSGPLRRLRRLRFANDGRARLGAARDALDDAIRAMADNASVTAALNTV